MDLVKHLHNEGIACVGTARLEKTIELWTSDYEDIELRAIKWFDNRGNSLLFTYESVNPIVHISRFDRKTIELVNMSCISIVSIYNKFMVGVQLLDSLLKVYKNHKKKKKKCSGITDFPTIFLMLLLYILCICTAEVSLVMKESSNLKNSK